MCGIVGFVNTENRGNLQELLEKCLDSISHRGPDSNGVFYNEYVSLAHTLLHITDSTDVAKQPFLSFDKRYIITYNGELYNTAELRNHLIRDNFSFKSESDTEVVLNAYIKWGNECVNHFSGMFAFCIYDTVKHQLFLARDIFGEKPLYYSLKNGFSFSSEFKPFDFLVENKSFNPIALNHFLTIGYVLSPHTIFEDIFSIPPSSFMIYDLKKRSFVIKKYYNYVEQFENKTTLPFEDIVEKTEVLLRKSIESRISGSFPFGVFLSGGLDSASIAYLLKEKGIDFPAFNIRFSNSLYDEYSKSQKICDELGLSLFDVDMQSIDRFELNQFIKTADYTTFDNANFPLFKLAELAKQSVKYVLTGDGSDEIFGGYSTYKADRLNRQLRFLTPLLKQIGYILPNKNDKVGTYTKMKRFTEGVNKDYKKAHFNWRRIFTAEERIQIMGEQYSELILESDPFFEFVKYYKEVSHLSEIDQHLYVDTQTWLTNNILIKMDRSTMLAGLEARCPFLDKDLVSFIASCPVKFKKDKMLLKNAMKGVLPDRIINQTKTGLNAPVSNWFGTKHDEFQFYTNYIYELKYERW